MIESNRLNIIVAAAVVFALIISVALVGIGNMQGSNGSMKNEVEYAAKVFGTDIISIEIIADEVDWQEMLDNATSEQYIMADVVVNGTKFQNVGIRPKGNSSLIQVASSGSDRYSFRLQFDEYIKDQTCFGLESFVLNNMLGDNTYMKEYVSYELMREVGVDAPFFGYADIKVNGESWGLYLAVELYNDSYEQRVFGNTSGMLYNVKSMDMGGNLPGQPGGNPPAMPDGQNPPGMPGGQNPLTMPDGQNRPFMPGGQNPPTIPRGQTPPTMPDGQNLGGNEKANLNSPPNTDNTNSPSQNSPEQDSPAQRNGDNSNMNRRFAARGRVGSSGGSLEYIDDNIESYRAIFNNVVGKGTEKDYQRVVQALKALSEGKDLETYFDVDKILRYLAAHTFVVNLDSYSSGMAQNYYLYERDGQITILPWDYNLAWGGFQSGSASSVINFPIDTPVSGVEISSRPLIEKLFANEEYLERYHGYLQQLIDNYFANGQFAEKINSLDALIADYVKNDPTAFCTFEEYRTAVSSFITLGNLRAQSVQGQLDGTVPSTTAEQKANPDQLISAGELKLSDLGSMMGGRGGNNGDFPNRMGGQDRNFPETMNSGIDAETMRKVLDIIRQANGEIGDEEKEALLSLGLTEEQIKQFSAMGGGRFGGNPQNGEPRKPPMILGGMGQGIQ
ncbi:MAG: spore coat protein CotH, partial [Syntrophomonadaceae bacterium]|nr:spore coat protein CotH [Syntrophomonadaceae bacterium]